MSCARDTIGVTRRRDAMVDDADPDVPSGVADGERGATPLDVSEVASSGFDRRLRACPAAAAAGDVTRLKRARENGCPWDERTCVEAARGGHLECLKYLHENGYPWDSCVVCTAARGGHLGVGRWEGMTETHTGLGFRV